MLYCFYLKIYLTGNPQLGEIKNKPTGVKIIYQNPQEWLSHTYSNKDHVETINLNDLEFDQPSELVIDDYPNLREVIK